MFTSVLTAASPSLKARIFAAAINLAADAPAFRDPCDPCGINFEWMEAMQDRLESDDHQAFLDWCCEETERAMLAGEEPVLPRGPERYQSQYRHRVGPDLLVRESIPLAISGNSLIVNMSFAD